MSLLTVYVHGIGDHGSADKVKVDWDAAIFGKGMTYKTRAAFWSNILHPATDGLAKKSLAVLAPPNIWEAKSLPGFVGGLQVFEEDQDKIQFMSRLAMQMTRQDMAAGPDAKFVPLPEWLRSPMTKIVTSLFIKDVAAYFYEPDKRSQIRQRLLECLATGHTDYILVTHSMGTVIAYDVLSDSPNISVPLWVTIGSPLGIQEVQDRLLTLRDEKVLKKPSCVRQWKNFADRLDVVAVDPTIKDDFGNADASIEDFAVENPDRLDLTQYGPHSGTGYLRIPLVSRSIIDKAKDVAGEDYLKALSNFLISNEVAREINSSQNRIRIPVLIELDDKSAGGSLSEKRETIVSNIRQITKTENIQTDGENPDPVELDAMVRFVSAKLTTREIDELNNRATAINLDGTQLKLTISRIWRNREKRALMNDASTTVHGTVSRLGYAASGKGVGWAVLDSGVTEDHPHFAKYGNIKKYWDCTRRGVRPAVNLPDPNGHGTHVCGIIAGEGTEKSGVIMTGIAPEAELHVYKVLKDSGSGEDSFIIKALDHIASVNEAASKLIIQGVNLSLGGPFDLTTFACGHSPICRELRRLWRQGVLIVVACGNEGATEVLSPDGSLLLNTDVTISDPANLEECIAVGSVHKSSPHFFGPSFFSSRGPTADGRYKPDVVAPGEKILSCNSDFKPKKNSNYVEMSGTSMAAPVVSGLLAGFLSVRTEFIGRPDHVKDLLLKHCTDISRDRYFQGSGVPNLVKMILNT